jgi:UDP-N-acetylglucosamine 2-epimerase (non-hydrolysing)
MRLLVPLGTRPEIVKLAPVVQALAARPAVLEVRTVATGQHYDPALTDRFFDDLALTPDARWDVGGDEGQRVGQILTLAFREIADHRPDAVLVLGDTYTVPLFCLAARRHAVPVIHLEAGLRSHNELSVEETHRRLAAVAASLHLAPTELAARNLRAEAVPPERIRVVGNPVIDVLRTAGPPRRPPAERRGIVLTAHRPTNVDDPERLERLIDLAARLRAEIGPVTFPLHPRTRTRLAAVDGLRRLEACGVGLLPPLPYPAMLSAIAGAQVIVTDSGGLQEEASWFGVPVVVLRHSTPRWEGVEAGTSVLTGLDPGAALAAAAFFTTPDEQRRVAAEPCPYGDGHTAVRVAGLLAGAEVQDLLRLREPAPPVPALP